MIIELIEAPIVLDIESKPDVRTQLGNVNTSSQNNTFHRQSNEVSALVAEAQSEETDKDSSQSKLPKEAKARFGKGGINAIQFSPDGMRLAVEPDIGVWLYNMETGEEKFLFEGMCQSLAFSMVKCLQVGVLIKQCSCGIPPQGSHLRHSLDMLWKVTTGDRITVLDGHTQKIETLAFSSDNKTLVSTGADGTILLWDWNEVLTGASKSE